MELLNWLETRLTLPTDSETQRRQKAFAYIPAVSTTFLALAWALIFLAAGLTVLGQILLVYTLACVLAVVCPLFAPRLALLFGIGLTIVGIVLNLLSHLAAGGFDSGMWFLLWVVIMPLSAFLAGGIRRLSLPVLGLALIGLTIALAVDARLAPPLPIPHWLRLSYNGFVLFVCVVVLFFWGVYTFAQLEDARQRADSLLLNILPAPIAMRLKQNPGTIADGYDEVTVLFADIVNFTKLSADADPVDVVAFLNTIFSEFDELALKHGLEKIKTIGDAYMVAGGLPTPRPDHCQAVVAFGLDMLQAVKQCTAWHGEPVHLRVGVNTGPVVAGVIGRHKFIYDLWGDAVNIASRMESKGVPDVIQVTGAVKERLAGRYVFEERPAMTIKGRGEMVTYLLRAVN